MSAGEPIIEASPSILRRKLRSEPASSQEQAVSPAKAARLSLARAADKAFELPMRVNAIRQSRLDLEDVVESLDEGWAIYPLVNDDGSIGVMCFDPSCVIAFMERQTKGSVNQSIDETRRLTRTDKALVAAFLEVFFNLFNDALLGAPTAYWTRGYRAEDAVQSRHLMVLLLEASEYRGFDISCDVSGLGRPCSMRLFLPIKEKQVALADASKSKKKSRSNTEQVSSKTMRGAALAATVELDAVMCKVTLPLSELNTLKAGQLVHLPQNAAAQAQLVDHAGHTSRAVNLGQLHGMRAVRLVLGESDDDFGQKPEEIEAFKPKEVAPEEIAPKPVAAETSASEVGDDLDALLAASSR